MLGRKDEAAVPTNVTRITRAISQFDKKSHPQVVYYQAGVGTGIGLRAKLFGGGTGEGLSENIREAYGFLAHNYFDSQDASKNVVRDSIFLIGFSRGSFTARSLGGLIASLGLLKKSKMQYFYMIFKDWENAGNPDYTPTFLKERFEKNGFDPNIIPAAPKSYTPREDIENYLRKYRAILTNALTQEVTIKAIGVWDTVGSLGIPVSPWVNKALSFLHLPSVPTYMHEYKWYDTTIDDHVKNAFHALGLDERRTPFSPAVWSRPRGTRTNLKQVWFPGSHSNIGGGYADTAMSDITLAWMMDQLSGGGPEAQKRDGFSWEDWIKFEDGYIGEQYVANQAWYDDEMGGKRRVWSTGTIYNSSAFPFNLFGFSGTTRSPGLYHRTDYDTGKIDPDTLLEDTNEYIHASVRERIAHHGFTTEQEASAYLPPKWKWFPQDLHMPTPGLYKSQDGPLKHWTQSSGDQYRDAVPGNNDNAPKWIYEGPPEKTNYHTARGMPEDRLQPGGYEIMLLRNWSEIAHDVEARNRGEHAWDGVREQGRE
ncbi:hypothetical protein BJ546DRAFT_837577 [Cryomyces antarcticus]